MPEPVQVAFRVYANDWGFRGHGSRQIDWLVDGKLLHQDNVLFVIDQPISRAYKKALQAKYRVYEVAPYWSTNLRWARFLKNFHPKHWVSYNDFHPRHIARNGFLRKAGVQTWHYSHSVNLPHVYGQPNYTPWEKLDYDHLVLWNETDAAAFHGGKKHVLGPLFSSQIPRLVIAIFDSTWEHYHDGAREKFFADLAALLDRHADIVMLYKPKLKPPPMPVVDRFFILPEWVAPGLVIGCAGLTIGLAYTSPVAEACGAGRMAVWYDPMKESVEALERAIHNVMPRIQDDPAQRFRELLLK